MRTDLSFSTKRTEQRDQEVNNKDFISFVNWVTQSSQPVSESHSIQILDNLNDWLIFRIFSSKSNLYLYLKLIIIVFNAFLFYLKSFLQNELLIERSNNKKCS